MVQIALYAGLGFFSALILALAVSPMLRRRTVRLTERRLRAELPQSMEEIRADRDSLRAEYAMRERQLEIMVEKLKDAAVERTLLIERRNEEVYALKGEARQRIEIISDLRDEIDELRDVLQEKDEDLARHKTKIREVTGQLERKMKQLERAEIRTGELEDRLEKQRTELIETRAALRNSEHHGGALVNGHDYRRPEEAPAAPAEPAIEVARAQPRREPVAAGPVDEEAADLRDQITELEASKLALELRARTSEEELATMEGQVAELEQKIVQFEQAGGAAEPTAEQRAVVRELADLKNRVTQLETEIARKDARIAALASGGSAAAGGADTGEAEALRARLIETEAEKAAFEAEVTRLAMELETVRAADTGAGASEAKAAADRARALERELAAARRERDDALARTAAIEEELKSVQALQDSEHKIEQAEIALLRESLSELAADVAHIVVTLEGEGSPIDDILSRGNGHDDSDADMVSLAERIKSLRERSVGQLQG